MSEKEYLGIFLDEGKEHLEILNDSILNLEKNPRDKTVINEIFRVAHSMKGMSGAMEFRKMQELTHSMEDVLQDIREEKLEVNDKVINLLLICHDYLDQSLEFIKEHGEEAPTNIDTIMKRLHEIAALHSVQVSTSVKGITPLKQRFVDEQKNLLVTVILDKECLFKAVRAFMVFQVLEKFCLILKSDPPREELESGNFEFQSRVITAIVTSETFTGEQTEKIRSLLLKEIRGISEINDVIVDLFGESANLVQTNNPVKLVDAASKGKVETSDVIDLIIGAEESEKKEVDVEAEFLQNFLMETKDRLDSLEIPIIDLETNPMKKEAVQTLFRGFHTISGMAGFVNQEEIKKISKKIESLLDIFQKNGGQIEKEFVDLLIASTKFLKEMVQNYSLQSSMERQEKTQALLVQLNDYENVLKGVPSQEFKKIGTILLESGKITQKELDALLTKQKTDYPQYKLGQVALKEKKAGVEDVVQALRTQEEGKKETVAPAVTTEGSFMRIPAFKVDTLVDMMGELVIVQSQIAQQSGERFDTDDKLVSHLMRMSRIVKNIQNLSMSLRMVSLKSLFQKLNRIARDTMSGLSKHVNFSIYGEDTEIDRNVVDRLLDPLVHLVRNAIDHGVENSEERERAEKPRIGEVKLVAYSKRGNVYIEVSDDGKGLNTELITQKAIEKGLISPDKTYTPEEVHQFIFLPGFSTAKIVSQVSGRGVGLDVVKTEISKIGGKVEIITNAGKGSTFILKIPINLAVIDGTVVRIFGSPFILPTLNVKQILKPTSDQIISVRGKKNMIKVRGDIVPIIQIDRFFSFEGILNHEENLILILELEQKLKALPIHEMIGRREIVVKPLGNEFNHLNFLSGASILGDGKVALIFDVENLFRRDD